jgi:peptidoglycan hydrolase-like protein with peptidoglycan-binding domain
LNTGHAAQTTHTDYSLSSLDNFKGNPDLAQQLTNVMRTAKDSTGELYLNRADVKNAPPAKQAIMAWQHYLQDHGSPDIKIDGLMGTQTRQATRSFLSNNGYTGAVNGDGFDVATQTAMGNTLKNSALFDGNAPASALTANTPASQPQSAAASSPGVPPPVEQGLAGNMSIGFIRTVTHGMG